MSQSLNSHITISIIIPVRNEYEHLTALLGCLKVMPGKEQLKEIIISDGQSTDNSVAIAKSFGANVVLNDHAGRGLQMNSGAAHATGSILYFLHADSVPPKNLIEQITNAVNNGAGAGCFRLRFDWDHWFLKANAWFSRFNVNAVRFGDQSLFIEKEIFDIINGFREDLIIMEDQEIIYRICKQTKFKVIADYIITSARKYRVNGAFRMQGIFFYIYFSYLFGASQQRLVSMYKRLIRL
ncbi:MAG: TIGR04283 family arsenosugar biosynthesis glycosyltransferase [Panacibacter sp.]